MATCCSSFYGSGFADARALSFVNLYKYGGGFDMAADLAAKISPFGLFETRRLIGAAVGIAGLIVTWRLGRRIGGPIAGLAALILLAACPLYYGHMFMNAKDAPFAVAMAVLLLGSCARSRTIRSRASRTVLLTGAGLGAGFRLAHPGRRRGAGGHCRVDFDRRAGKPPAELEAPHCNGPATFSGACCRLCRSAT